MYVGYTLGGRLIEVAIEIYPEGEDDWMFHARKAGPVARRFWKQSI